MRVGAAVAACCAGALAPTPASAQAAAAAAQAGTPPVVLQTSLTVQETLTDNRELTTDRHADAVTQVYPSVRISGRSAHVQGSFDYAPVAVIYARDTRRSDIQNALSAYLNAALLDDHVFLDARAGISQQSISAFGTQFSGTDSNVDNRSEVATLGLAPRVHGNVAGYVDVDALANYNVTRASGSGAGDLDALYASFAIAGTRGGPFGWSAALTRLDSDYSASRKTTQDNATLQLTYAPVVDLRLGIDGGREWSDAETGSRQASDRYGVSIDWQPSDRTRLSAIGEKRYFGHSHNIVFEHRAQRSTWRYSDTKDVSSSPAVQAALTLNDTLTYAYPDPVERDRIIRERGYTPGQLSRATFQLAALSVQRSQNLAISYNALRTTFTLTGYRTDTRRLDTLSIVDDDLSSADRVRQQGASFGVSHSLTPTAALGLSAALQKTRDGGDQPGNEQRIYNLTWSDQIGARTTATLGARYVQFHSSSSPYREAALFGSIGMRF